MIKQGVILLSNIKALEHFEEKLNQITDSDIGDYKRKAQLYLNRLKSELKTGSKELVILIGKVDELISFQYEQDIDTVHMQIKESISEMRSHL